MGESEIFDYLEGTLRIDVAGLDADSPLFSSGAIDSFSMIDLITHLEVVSGTRIQPSDITLDNFDTVRRIINFLSRQT